VTEQPRSIRYRRLFQELGEQPAREMIDKLQIVALTSPETVRELEAFLDRKAPEPRGNPDSHK
jgi:uroporphyrinogen-III synthase